MLKFTVTWMPLRHLWPRERERERESHGEETVRAGKKYFQNYLIVSEFLEILPIIYFRFTLSLSKMRNVCARCICVHLCACVCVCVYVCVIQKQLSVTRASITGRMSAEITAHCLQRNLSVSCKRWRGRRRKSEPGKYFSLWRCNQQCSALRSLK